MSKVIDKEYLLAQFKGYDEKVASVKYNVKFQLSTIPTAAEALKNTIVQYIGETDATYTNGYFYKCVEKTDAESGTKSYVWEAVTQDAAVYSIKKLDTATDGYAASYQLAVNGEVIADSQKIDIPKDFFLKDATMDVVTEADKAEGGKFADKDTFAVGDTYIDFEVNLIDSSEAKHIYLNIKTLADVYTAGNGISIDSDTKVVSVKLNADSGLKFAGDDSDELAIDFETEDIDFENDWEDTVEPDPEPTP